jgi:TetR/AcrR family tetracycline transcriptional repressor
VMASTHEVLLAHPDLVPVYLARQGARGPNAQQLGEVMLALLARAGVTGPRAREALRVLIVYTIGFAAFVTRGPLDTDPEPPADELLRNFDSGLHWLVEAITRGE